VFYNFNHEGKQDAKIEVHRVFVLCHYG